MGGLSSCRGKLNPGPGDNSAADIDGRDLLLGPGEHCVEETVGCGSVTVLVGEDDFFLKVLGLRVHGNSAADIDRTDSVLGLGGPCLEAVARVGVVKGLLGEGGSCLTSVEEIPVMDPRSTAICDL